MGRWRLTNRSLTALPFVALGGGLLLLLLAPLSALGLTVSPGELWSAIQHPLVMPALLLSLRTSLIALAVVVVCGIPLAWVIGRSQARPMRLVELLLALPIVMPPAVVGIALLLAFGRESLLGRWLDIVGLTLPFTPAAVVVAQVVVAGPFFVKSAISGFRQLDDDLLLVARTLGAGRFGACVRVGLPAALPALASGAALCWARATGEFGATLLFAGNLSGRTQTMPLAIYSALQLDLDVARALAILLGLAGLSILLVVHLLSSFHPLRSTP
jgi:molybdate transport system permease protein